MPHIQTIVLFFVTILMVMSSKERKLIIFLFSLVCMNMFSFRMGAFSSAIDVLTFTYIISESREISRSLEGIKDNKIYWPVIIMIIPTVLLAVYSPHYSSPLGFLKIVIREIVLTYSMLWIGYSIIEDYYDLKKIYKYILKFMIILTIFSIVNIILHNAPWISYFSSNFDESRDILAERFRVRSLFFNSFNYGFMCLMVLSFSYWARIKNIITKSMWYSLLSMCIFGALVSGSRTIVVCLFIFSFGCIFTLPSYRKIIRYYLLSISIVVLAYLFIPYITDKFNMLLDTFNDSNTISGSSFEMRMMQFQTVLYYIRENLWFGNGYNYFVLDMGWGQLHEGGRVDADLRGLEGVYLKYLLERGIVGYVFYILFYLSLLFEIYRNKGNRTTIIIALTVVCVYLCFAHMTGDLATPPIALFFAGLFIKMSSFNFCK